MCCICWRDKNQGACRSAREALSFKTSVIGAMIFSLSITELHDKISHLRWMFGASFFIFFWNANSDSRGNSYSICHHDCILSSALFTFKLATLISQTLDIMWSCVVSETEMVSEISDGNIQHCCVVEKKKEEESEGAVMTLSSFLAQRRENTSGWKSKLLHGRDCWDFLCFSWWKHFSVCQYFKGSLLFGLVCH